MSTPEDIQQWHVTEPYVDLHCGLGEGPYYEKATQTLRFVDIKGKRIHTVSVTDGPASLTTLQLDERPTVTANVAGLDPQQKLLVGLKYGIALLDRPTGRYEYLARFTPAADNARLRSNDGAADPHGRFWLGTMTDFDLGDFQPEGKPPSPPPPIPSASLTPPRLPLPLHPHLPLHPPFPHPHQPHHPQLGRLVPRPPHHVLHALVGAHRLRHRLRP